MLECSQTLYRLHFLSSASLCCWWPFCLDLGARNSSVLHRLTLYSFLLRVLTWVIVFWKYSFYDGVFPSRTLHNSSWFQTLGKMMQNPFQNHCFPNPQSSIALTVTSAKSAYWRERSENLRQGFPPPPIIIVVPGNIFCSCFSIIIWRENTTKNSSDKEHSLLCIVKPKRKCNIFYIHRAVR